MRVRKRLFISILTGGLLFIGCGGQQGENVAPNANIPTNSNPGSGTPTPTPNAPTPPVAPTPPPTPPPPPPHVGSINDVNHIIILMQENRSFDHYFGKLGAYRVKQGLPAEVDGLPLDDKDNVKFFNLGRDGSFIPVFHMTSVCQENLSSAWNESRAVVNHAQQNYPIAKPKMDGFASVAGKFSADEGHQDVVGKRAMGYFTERELPYYYYMATQFATSDRFFSPIPSRTQPNRIAMFAATTAGHAYPLDLQINVKTIIELLDKAKISWKIYTAKPDGADHGTYFTNFSYANTHTKNIVHIAEYTKDAQSGTLPAVSVIETGVVEKGVKEGLDEHPENNVQVGAAFAADKINILMYSPSWKDSVLFLTYDEGGGFYDHVPPAFVAQPDGIRPLDLAPHDNPGDFNITGFRVPMIVISPFTKENYVSHTVMDFTAFLKFIETRFGLPSLTKRDASMPDMTEFFDFNQVPWLTPPPQSEVPIQPTNAPCFFFPVLGK